MVTAVELRIELINFCFWNDVSCCVQHFSKGNYILSFVAQPANGDRLRGDIPNFDEPCDRAVELSGELPGMAHQFEIGVVRHHGLNLRPDVLIKPALRKSRVHSLPRRSIPCLRRSRSRELHNVDYGNILRQRSKSNDSGAAPTKRLALQSPPTPRTKHRPRFRQGRLRPCRSDGG